MKTLSAYQLYVVFYLGSESIDDVYTSKEDAEAALKKIPEKFRKNHSVMTLDEAIYDIKRNYHYSQEYPDDY